MLIAPVHRYASNTTPNRRVRVIVRLCWLSASDLLMRSINNNYLVDLKTTLAIHWPIHVQCRTGDEMGLRVRRVRIHAVNLFLIFLLLSGSIHGSFWILTINIQNKWNKVAENFKLNDEKLLWSVLSTGSSRICWFSLSSLLFCIQMVQTSSQCSDN